MSEDEVSLDESIRPRGWMDVDLGSLSTFVTSGSRGWADYYATDGALFLRITNLSRSTIHLDLRDRKHVRLPDADSEGRRTRVEPGDILISITADLGIVGVVPEDGIGEAYINQHIALVRPDHERLVPHFGAYFLGGPGQRQFVRLNDGGAKAGLNLPSVRKLRILVPPLPEQRKIAAILSSVDDAIEATQAVIDQLQVVKKAIMAELLTRGLPGHHTRFKQTEIGEVPEDWDVVPLDSCVETDRPICYGILMPGTGHPGGVPVVKVKNIKNGVIDLSDLLLTSPELDRQYARSRLRPGDVLLTIRGTTGRLARVPAALANANITQDTARLSIRSDKNPDYIFYALQSECSQRQIRDQTRGQAVKGINIGDVRKIIMPLPHAEERKRIVQLFASIDDLDALNGSELRAHKIVKSGLMSVLLTGELRVTPDKAAA